jgi:F-type H+-transporting ATPase subunit b
MMSVSNFLFLLASETSGHSGEDHGPKLLGLGAEGWVYTGITIFILVAIFYAKAHRKIIDGLDARIAETKRELDEAAAIRAEAETLLAQAKSEQSNASRDAKAILNVAESEAAALLSKAEIDAKALIARRTKMAEDSIIAAQRTAVAEVRASAANLATQAAATVLASQHDAKSDATLVDAAIAQLN